VTLYPVDAVADRNDRAVGCDDGVDVQMLAQQPGQRSSAGVGLRRAALSKNTLLVPLPDSSV
jgi:hypothetical protein